MTGGSAPISVSTLEYDGSLWLFGGSNVPGIFEVGTAEFGGSTWACLREAQPQLEAGFFRLSYSWAGESGGIWQAGVRLARVSADLPADASPAAWRYRKSFTSGGEFRAARDRDSALRALAS
jgi:hypothetical protein